MDNIVFLIFRRMRRPLMTLLVVYSIAILGLTLIPGVDELGNPRYLDFFHATYFVSFMATTIGFGEIPFEFNDAQRLWVTASMYAGVISWLYAIGTILSLLQDKTFQHALSEKKLSRKIRTMQEPFFLICGYGETGSALVKGLTDVGQHVVVIEKNEYRRNMISIDNLRDFVPSLHGDAQKPLHLQDAGLQHDMCKAVVAVTNVNEANLKIAITSKLLHPHIKVICRADSHDVENNMASFGTDHIIDPFDTFALSLSIAFQTPSLYLLESWLFSANSNIEMDEPIFPPIKHHWVICGYGRFGKAVYKRLKKEGISVVVLEAFPEKTGEPSEGVIKGRGTEANTLIEAEIESASAIIAGTDNDANNLSMVVTARELNPDLFVVIRQNHADNSAIIDAVSADMVMHSSKIIADKIRILLGTPMLHQFISQAYYQDNQWSSELVSRISALIGHQAPTLTEIPIDKEQTQAVAEAIAHHEIIRLGDLLRDPWLRENNLNCIILMIERDKHPILLPDNETEIKLGDRLLVCADASGFTRLRWNLQHENILSYVRTGDVKKHGWVWKKLFHSKK